MDITKTPVGILVTLAAVTLLFCTPAASATTLTHLRCEYLVDPLGIDVVKPRLSWVMESARRGERQTAYQILVASTPELLVKDQGTGPGKQENKNESNTTGRQDIIRFERINQRNASLF
jgi:hypothetical protein